MIVEAKRGHIYEFSDGKNNEKRYAVVVSANYRCRDKLVSIIILNDYDGGHDVVTVDSTTFGRKYIHCGMITYTHRTNLICEVGKLTEKKLKEVEYIISREFTINVDVQEEANFYHRAYDDVLEVLRSTLKGGDSNNGN